MADSYKPTSGMVTAAKRALEWRSEFGRGGTEVGIARARDISNEKNLSADTVKRMYSFFSRHEVDKQATGFNSGEEGFPSNGRIAWDLWGGDAGFSWSKRITESMKSEQKKSLVDLFSSFLDEHFGGSSKDTTTLEVSKSLDEDKRLATFVVLAPDEVDLHGDIYDAEEVEKACHDYNRNCMKANLAHMFMVDDETAYVVESYITPSDFQLDDKIIKKGTWLQTWKIPSETIWKGVKDGYWTGLSIGCVAETEDLV